MRRRGAPSAAKVPEEPVKSVKPVKSGKERK
jgi:hypothetical protein